MVAEAGQRVARRALAQLGHRGGHPQRARRLAGEQLEQLGLLGVDPVVGAVGDAAAARGARRRDTSGSTITRVGAGLAQHLVALEAAAAAVAGRVARGAHVDPGGDPLEVGRLERAERDRERALGVVDVEAAVAVGEREHRGLEAGQRAGGGDGLADDVLGLLERAEPHGDARELLGGRDVGRARRAPPGARRAAPAQRSTSAIPASPGGVGDSALSTPATRPPTRSGMQTSACTEATASR